MEVSLNRAKLLLKLDNEETMTLSKFSKNKKVIAEYVEKEIITIISLAHGKRVKQGSYFQSHIECYYGGNLMEFINTDTRGESVKKYGDDKVKHIAPQEGLFVWTKDTIQATDKSTILNEKGMITFIHESVNFNLDKTVEVVGVENFESLVHANALYQSFNFSKKVLFVYRNKSFLKLIQKCNNPIKYIPDYDIFGIRIYETEVLKYNHLVELLIPINIEYLFNSVKTEKRYLTQKYMKGGHYKAITQKGEYLLELMEKYKCIIPQEYLHSF
jgi:hypothetical protein